MDADGLGGGDGTADGEDGEDGEDGAACDGDDTTTGGGTLALGWLAAGGTLGDTLVAPALAVTAALAVADALWDLAPSAAGCVNCRARGP